MLLVKKKKKKEVNLLFGRGLLSFGRFYECLPTENPPVRSRGGGGEGEGEGSAHGVGALSFDGRNPMPYYCPCFSGLPPSQFA